VRGALQKLFRENRPTREQLLAAVPVRNELAKESPRGRQGAKLGDVVLRLTAPMKQSRWRAVLSSGTRAGKSFDLDELGAFVWQSLDGRRTVEAVIARFAKEKRVNPREAEVAVLAFLKTLTQRGLVALAIVPRGGESAKIS
jgi:hypothetical protein